MYIPERANFIFGWSIYIEDEWAYLQNNMIAAENISGKINIDALDEAMPLRATFDDENREISEWKTSRLSVFDFSNRLKQKLKM
jgi:macrodomain Ter protein organizer (MatP/YcbG family)